MIVLDASVLLALLASSDPHHATAVEILSLDGPFRVHTMSLAEALVRGERDDRASELISRFDLIGVAELPRQAEEARRLAGLRVQTRLKLPDCCVLLAAESAAATLATFDGRLARAAQQRGIEVLGADL